MNNGLKITAYAAVLAATFGVAYGVGNGVDPLVAAEAQPAAEHGGHGAEGEGAAGGAAGPAGGLGISDGGYTLELRTPAVATGVRTEIRFAVVEDGTAAEAGSPAQPEAGRTQSPASDEHGH